MLLSVFFFMPHRMAEMAQAALRGGAKVALSAGTVVRRNSAFEGDQVCRRRASNPSLRATAAASQRAEPAAH